MRLTVNETKTRVCSLTEEKFDFSGYRFGRCYPTKMARAVLGTVPSKNGCKGPVEPSATNPNDAHPAGLEDTLRRLYRMMIGWATLLCQGPVSLSLSGGRCGCVRNPMCGRQSSAFRQNLSTRFRLGLLTQAGHQSSVDEIVSLFREPDAVASPVRFDERCALKAHGLAVA
jgi:hypothetical protein